MKKPEGINLMSTTDMHNTPRCQHVRLSGRPCQAPARRGTNYCLFHEAEHANDVNLTFPPVEDAATVAVATDQVLGALRDDTIDFRRDSQPELRITDYGFRFTLLRSSIGSPPASSFRRTRTGSSASARAGVRCRWSRRTWAAHRAGRGRAAACRDRCAA